MLVHWKSSCAAYQTTMFLLDPSNWEKYETSNAGTAELADTVERLSLLKKMLEIRKRRNPHAHSLFKNAAE